MFVAYVVSFLGNRIIQLFSELSASGDFVFARVEPETVAKFVFSDEADFVDLGNSHRLALTFRGTTVEDRILKDDFVSHLVDCFLLWCCFNQFHLVVVCCLHGYYSINRGKSTQLFSKK